MKHPAVAMSAVVGIPDPIRTESIKAWIVLRPGFAPGDALAREIQEFVKVQLAAHEYPRYVQFTDTLPMTATGKVLRRELRALGQVLVSCPDAAQRAALAAWCAADPGPTCSATVGPRSAEQREERCTASGTRSLRRRDPHFPERLQHLRRRRHLDGKRLAGFQQALQAGQDRGPAGTSAGE